MINIFKKIFNISCLLGLHDNVHIATMTGYDLENLVRNQMVDRGASTWVVNSLPFPRNMSKIYNSSVCSCCGKFTNEIYKYSMDRSKLYYELYPKHEKAVSMYLEKNKDLIDEVNRKKDKSWDINKEKE